MSVEQYIPTEEEFDASEQAAQEQEEKEQKELQESQEELEQEKSDPTAEAFAAGLQELVQQYGSNEFEADDVVSYSILQRPDGQCFVQFEGKVDPVSDEIIQRLRDGYILQGSESGKGGTVETIFDTKPAANGTIYHIATQTFRYVGEKQELVVEDPIDDEAPGAVEVIAAAEEVFAGDPQTAKKQEISWIDRLFAERVTTEKVVQRIDVSDAAAPTFEKITDLFPDTVTLFTVEPEQQDPRDLPPHPGPPGFFEPAMNGSYKLVPLESPSLQAGCGGELQAIVQSPIGTEVVIPGETFMGPERVPRDAMVFSREETGVAITYVEAREPALSSFEQRSVSEIATSTSSTTAESMLSLPKEPVTILTIAPELENNSIAEPEAMTVDVCQPEVGAVQFREEAAPLSPALVQEQVAPFATSPDVVLPQPERVPDQFLVAQTPLVPTAPDTNLVTVEQNSREDTFTHTEAALPVWVSPELSSPDLVFSQLDQAKESLTILPLERQVAPGTVYTEQPAIVGEVSVSDEPVATASLTLPVSKEPAVPETVVLAPIENTKLVTPTEYLDITSEKITPQQVVTGRVVTETDQPEQSAEVKNVVTKTEAVIKNTVVDATPDQRAITVENSLAEKNEVSHEPEAKLLASERAVETVEAEPTLVKRESAAASSEAGRKEEDLKIAFQGTAEVVSPIARPRRTIRITEAFVDELFGQSEADVVAHAERISELRRQTADVTLPTGVSQGSTATQVPAAITA